MCLRVRTILRACMRVCVYACVCACMRACMRACVRACVCVHASVLVGLKTMEEEKKLRILNTSSLFQWS